MVHVVSYPRNPYLYLSTESISKAPPPPVPLDRTPDPSSTTSLSSFCPVVIFHITNNTRNATQRTHFFVHIRSQTVVDEADTFLVPNTQSPSPPPPTEEEMEEDSTMVPEKAPLPSPSSPPPSPPVSPSPSPAEETMNLRFPPPIEELQTTTGREVFQDG